MLFIKVREMSFSKNLVKDQTVVKKHWHLASVTVRVERGSFIVFFSQIEEFNGTGSPLMGTPLLSFKPLPWCQICQLLTLHFCCDTSVMAGLFSFDNVLKVIQGDTL